MIKSLKNVYIFFSLILLISVITITIVEYINLPPCNLVQTFEEPRLKEFYYDLDSDGTTERVTITEPTENFNSNITSFVIYNNLETVVNQFNFPNFLLKSKINYFDDLDGDNFNEIEFIHQEKDTLFYSVINVGKNKISPNKLPIFYKPKRVKGTWDIMYCEFFYLPSDKEKRFLYFSIAAGYSIFPRSLYKFDLKKNKIVKEFRTTSPFVVRHGDINKDGSDEIYLNSYASNNTSKLKENLPYPDTTTYFILLDEELNLKWYYSNKSQVLSNAVSSSKTPKFINLNMDLNNNENSEVCLYDFNGKLLKKKKWPPELIAKQNLNKENEFSSFNDFNNILSIDTNLALKEIYRFDTKTFYAGSFFTAKKDTFYLFFNYKELFLFDANFNLYAKSESTTSKYSFNTSKILSIKYSETDENPYLVISDDLHTKMFLIEKRNVYLIVVKALALFLLINLLLYVFIKIILRLIIYFQTVSLAVAKSASGTIILNDGHKIISFNKSANILFNEKLKTNKNLTSILEKGSPITTILDRAKQNHAKETDEIDILLKGDSLKILVEVVPIILQNKLVIAYFVRLTNQTDLIMKERSKVWFHSMQKIAHEIKTPLSSMLLNLHSIEKNIVKQEPDREIVNRDIGVIKNEITRIKTLTNNLLKFADLQKLNFQEVNFLDIVEKTKYKFISFIERGVDLSVIFNGKIVEKHEEIIVLADTYQIEEVMQVLLENSIDAIRGKGKIKIVLQTESDAKLNISLTDDGKGISDEQLSKVFAPYFTTKKEGTGMGLAIANKIVKDHKSQLKVKSQIGIGTTFSFKLPLIVK